LILIASPQTLPERQEVRMARKLGCRLPDRFPIKRMEERK